MKPSLILLLFSLILVLGGACSKHNHTEAVPTQEAVYGRWVIFEVGLLDGKTNAQMEMEASDPCNGESEWVLNKDDSYSLNAYHKNAEGLCTMTRSRVGHFSFDPSKMELNFLHEGHSDERYTLYLINPTEMWLNIGLIDTGSPADRVYHIVKFKKQVLN